MYWFSSFASYHVFSDSEAEMNPFGYFTSWVRNSWLPRREGDKSDIIHAAVKNSCGKQTDLCLREDEMFKASLRWGADRGTYFENADSAWGLRPPGSVCPLRCSTETFAVIFWFIAALKDLLQVQPKLYSNNEKRKKTFELN